MFMPQANITLLVPGKPPGLLFDAEKGHFIIQTSHETLLTAPALWEPVLVHRARKRFKPVAFCHARKGPGSITAFW